MLEILRIAVFPYINTLLLEVSVLVLPGGDPSQGQVNTLHINTNSPYHDQAHLHLLHQASTFEYLQNMVWKLS